MRLCDPSLQHTTSAEGREIVSQMVDFLVAEGVTHPVKDAKVRGTGGLLPSTFVHLECCRRPPA